MKKNYIIASILQIVLMALGYYIFLPPLNIQAISFWVFFIASVCMFIFIFAIAASTSEVVRITNNSKMRDLPKVISIPSMLISIIIAVILIVNVACSPLFNAGSYSRRIIIDETKEFSNDIAEVDFNTLPLLDRDSSEKLGDRVMGQMSELVSQYYVSNQYTQINYNNEITRVTPLEYADIIKWFTNRKDGVKGYIKVNSVNGNTELVKLEKGMKYMPSAYFNENLNRRLRFAYPTTVFGDAKFEIDNDGNPYWIVPTYSYTAVGLKTKVSGAIIFNPIDGTSKKYKMEDVELKLLGM